MEKICVSNKTVNYRNYARQINRRDRARKNVFKLVAVFLVFVAVFVMVILFSSNAVKANADENNQLTKYYKSVSIQYGDSLWSIADEYCNFNEYKDERAFIKEIKQINKMTSDTLKAGEYIIVPYFAE